MLRMITGEVLPDAGTIEIGDTIRIGYLAQEEPAGIKPAPVKVKALHGQRARAHGRNVAENGEKGRIQSVEVANIPLFAPQQDEGNRRLHPLVGKAHEKQQQEPPERHRAQVRQDVGQRIAEDEQQQEKNQRERRGADEIGLFSALVHARLPSPAKALSRPLI